MFRLALAMGRTVAELSREIGAKELNEWIAFYEVEPWGSIREDFRAGMIAEAAVLPHVKKGSNTSPDYFMNEYDWTRFYLGEEDRIEYDRLVEIEKQKNTMRAVLQMVAAREANVKPDGYSENE